MSVPRVSICLPNLNTRRYLEERIESILAQTYAGWELVVSDNYSDDGAWGFFEDLARRDERVRISQTPRDGMYANWNSCVERARGEFVYIATSDDTMAPECLQRLMDGLDANPDCELAHCRLRAIDEHGHDVPDWWSRDSMFARSSGGLLEQAHIRKAPFDGLLHLGGRSVYISITQLLIRRSLFARIGVFPRTWGSVGDFNWNMRAGLVANTVHVPNTWAGWRVHEAQATAKVELGSAEHFLKADAMIQDALEFCQPHLPAAIRDGLNDRWAAEAGERRAFDREIMRRGGASRRRAFVARMLCAGSGPAWEHTISKLLGWNPWQDRLPERVERWFAEVSFGPVLLPLPWKVSDGAMEGPRPWAAVANT
jgi:hypothetical protein